MFVEPEGFDPSPQDQGGDDALDSDADPDNGMTDVITLDPGENDNTIDAGYIPLASLGDRVFKDLDGDGIQDSGEPGVAGVTVNLWTDDDGNGTPDTQIATDTTDANGDYGFDGLDPDLTYVVQFVNDPAMNMPFTDQDQGNDDSVDSDANPDTGITGPIDLDPGENDDTIDAGLTTPLASLGDTVFEDQDGDGIQDPGEPGIPGVEVKLLDENGGVLATDTTDENGNYAFIELEPGDYQVMFVEPEGFDPSPQDQGGDDTLDSDADPTNGMTDVITLEPGENNDTIDAGYIPLASLGDRVFKDLDRDGIQDGGEPGRSRRDGEPMDRR